MTPSGVVTDDPVLFWGASLDLGSGTGLCRFRVHAPGDGSPAATDPTLATLQVAGNSRHANIMLKVPVASSGGLEWAFTGTAGNEARAFIYWTPLR